MWRSVERRRQKYGEDSRLYQSRVRGVSPAESEEALIRASWVQAAQARYEDAALRDGPPAWGVDVANSAAGDKAAVAHGLGACLLEVRADPCPDANVLGAQVVAEMHAAKGKPQHVGVDAVGVGAGAVNEAKRLGAHVVPLHGGPSKMPTLDEDLDVGPETRKVLNEERFVSLRAQMYWQMRMDLQHNRIALPPDEELLRDLIAPTWETRGGKILVEAKEEIVKRLGRSPNKGDAAVYWNWVRPRQRPRPGEDESLSAFSPAVLAAEAVRSRRLRRYSRSRWRSQLPADEMFGEY